MLLKWTFVVILLIAIFFFFDRKSFLILKKEFFWFKNNVNWKWNVFTKKIKKRSSSSGNTTLGKKDIESFSPTSLLWRDVSTPPDCPSISQRAGEVEYFLETNLYQENPVWTWLNNKKTWQKNYILNKRKINRWDKKKERENGFESNSISPRGRVNILNSSRLHVYQNKVLWVGFRKQGVA